MIKLAHHSHSNSFIKAISAGFGCGAGFGDASGHGRDWLTVTRAGDGIGEGHGNGEAYGSGDGYGFGDGRGSGYGDGNGAGSEGKDAYKINL